MGNGFVFSELTDFKKELMRDIAQDFPKETQKFLDKEKRKFLREVKKTAKANIGKKTGTYYKSLKAGKTHYNKNTKDIYTKVYADEKVAPHAHMIENGHFIVARGENKHKGAGRRSGKGGKKKGFILGKHIFKKAELTFQSTYEKDVEDFVQEFISKNF